MCDHKRTDGLMGDYCDGEAYADHPLFSETSHFTHKLQILLFFDDLEVVNPLGSHTKKHKIGESIDNPTTVLIIFLS